MLPRMLKLYPAPAEEVPLAGTYLAHALHRRGAPQSPFVFADFVASLDGRIAVDDPAGPGSALPAGLSSRGDFRLLQELQAQSDCIITHAGYLRAIAEGRLDDILQVGLREDGRDLASWRERQGLPPQPAIAIASASLDFTIPESVTRAGQRVLIATGAAGATRAEAWRKRGHEVILAGADAMVEGRPLAQALGRLGYRSLFLLAGPRMLETMLRDRMLGRLYLTLVHRLIGGTQFHTMVGGPELAGAGRLKLISLYQQEDGPDSVGQWFAAFEPVAGGET